MAVDMPPSILSTVSNDPAVRVLGEGVTFSLLERPAEGNGDDSFSASSSLRRLCLPSPLMPWPPQPYVVESSSSPADAWQEDNCDDMLLLLLPLLLPSLTAGVYWWLRRAGVLVE